MSSLITVLQQLVTAMFSTTEGSEGVVIQFFGWLTSASVLPYFAIGIGVSLLLLAVKLVKSSIWGD